MDVFLYYAFYTFYMIFIFFLVLTNLNNLIRIEAMKLINGRVKTLTDCT